MVGTQAVPAQLFYDFSIEELIDMPKRSHPDCRAILESWLWRPMTHYFDFKPFGRFAFWTFALLTSISAIGKAES